MVTVDILSIERLDTIPIARGAHEDRSGGLCAMELVAWLAGEPHSDEPQCVSPVIASFMRAWNDDLPNADRTRILRPLLPALIGTATTDADEQARAWLATDWLIRVFTPAWLDAAHLTEDAATLRALPEIATVADIIGAQPVLDCTRRSASRTRSSTSRRDAAGDAAGDAAWAAASDARAAAMDAGAAAWGALAPTVRALQASAADLVLRMAAVGRS